MKFKSCISCANWPKTETCGPCKGVWTGFSRWEDAVEVAVTAERERCETIVEGFVEKYRAIYDDDCRGGNELHSSYGGPLSVAEQILAKIRGEK